jgi:hypothetical protein
LVKCSRKLGRNVDQRGCRDVQNRLLLPTARCARAWQWVFHVVLCPPWPASGFTPKWALGSGQPEARAVRTREPMALDHQGPVLGAATMSDATPSVPARQPVPLGACASNRRTAYCAERCETIMTPNAMQTAPVTAASSPKNENAMRNADTSNMAPKPIRVGGTPVTIGQSPDAVPDWIDNVGFAPGRPVQCVASVRRPF